MRYPGSDPNEHRPDLPLRRRVLRGAAGTFSLNVVSSGLNLAIAILLARGLGLSGYGVVTFVIATLMILAIPSVFGLDRLLTREIAVQDRRGRPDLAQDLLAGTRALTLLVSVTVGLIAGAVTWFAAGGKPSATTLTMSIGLIALPLATWNRVQQGATLGLRRIVAAQSPEMVVRPLAFILLVLGLLAVVGPPLAPELVMTLHVVSFGVAVGMGAVFLRRAMPRADRDSRTHWTTRPSLARAVPFAAIGGASVVNNQAGIILLGLLATTEQSGLYGAAARLALLVPFPLTAMNAVLSPIIARLWDAGRIEDLQKLVTFSARITLVLSLPAALAFILFGPWFLAVAFPPEFVAAAPALAILSVGQLVNASMGSVGTLLMMTGHEGTAAGGVIAGALVVLVLGVILVPTVGVNGAAIAGAASLTAWNAWLAVATRRRLGIDSTALGLHPARDGLSSVSGPRRSGSESAGWTDE